MSRRTPRLQAPEGGHIAAPDGEENTMPRIFGHDLLAVIAAVILAYAVGFIMYGVLFTEMWMEMAGITQADAEGAPAWKMYLGIVMPILMVLGLAKLFKLTGKSDLMGHLTVGFVAWLGFAFPTLMYGWVYGIGYPLGLLVMDGAHLLISILVASAVLLWRKEASAAAAAPA
ncbi:DUF1761 domain-containing protein [Marinicauda algicola]|uniref:DUF1761 domain-containing protein n=2 Tax=Marinicauda algicola TaxID=2029849 RepID=A0A4S2H3V5_9PROT|nr:DUF1761 domain-containing protein [Marinicauda algicola]